MIINKLYFVGKNTVFHPAHVMEVGKKKSPKNNIKM